MSCDAVVVCIGNAFRRDDGVANAVAERAALALPESVAVIELDGEPARVVDAWTGARLALVVDAARSGDSPGTVRRIEVDGDGAVPSSRPASTHGYGLGDAVDLGRVLGQLPDRLVVYTVEGEDYSQGPGLSDAVAAAIPEVVARLVEEVDACASR
jgi:hydrogenase maturation protease